MTHRRLLSVVAPSLCRLPRARLRRGVHPLSQTYPQTGPAAAIIGYGRFQYGEPATRLGDLNGDHVADGLIVMACVFESQSNYSYEHVFAYRANGTFMGRIPISRNIPPSWAQYIVDLDQTGIRSQTVRVRVRHYRDGDAHCCPSRTSNLRFRWVNGRFRIIR